MKIKKLFIISACAFLLSGCSTTQDQSVVPSVPSTTSEPPSSSSEPPAPEKGEDILSDEIIEQNMNVNENYSEKQLEFSAKKMTLPTNATYEVYTNWRQYGVVIVRERKDEESPWKYGLYSYAAGKLLIEPRLEYDSFQFRSDNQFGCIFAFYDVDERYYLADGAGNILYSSDRSYFVSEIFAYGYYNPLNYSTIEIDDEIGLYSTLSVYDQVKNEQGQYTYKQVYKYFKYDEKGKATEIEKLPVIEEEGKQAGESYTAKESAYSFEKLGLERYYIALGAGRYAVYDLEDKLIGYVTVPTNVNGTTFIIGTKMYYQAYYVLANDAKEYDVLQNGYKTILETYCVDFETLETTKVDFRGVFYGETDLLDEEGLPTYGILRFAEIRADKLVGETKAYIIDEELVLHDEMTYKQYLSGGKLLSNGNIYYNRRLYNQDGEIIADFSNLDDIEVNYEKELFTGRRYSSETNRNYLVIVNNEGKLVIPDHKYNANYDYGFIINDVMRLRDYNTNEDVYYDIKAMHEIEYDKEKEAIIQNYFISKLSSSKTTDDKTIYQLSIRQIDKEASMISNLISYQYEPYFNDYGVITSKYNYFGRYMAYWTFTYLNSKAEDCSDTYLITYKDKAFEANAIAAPTKVQRIYADFGEWTANGAEIYAWAWKGTDQGQWYEFFDNGGTNGYFKVPENCDKIILVRFNPVITKPNWEDEANIWNKTGDMDISKGVLTFVSWGEKSGDPSIFDWITE